MSTRQFKPLTTAAPTDADLEAFAARRGMSTLTSIENEAKPTNAVISDAVQPTVTPPVATATRTARVALHLPTYLADDLKRRALDERCSVRFLILRALHDAGFDVQPNDLIADGRRQR